MNSWAKKATQTSHLVWEAPTKNVILSERKSREKAQQPVFKRDLRQLKTPEIKVERIPETGQTHAGVEV